MDTRDLKAMNKATTAQDLTEEQLEQLLEKKRKEKKAKQAKAKAAYEKQRDSSVGLMINNALRLSKDAATFKQIAHDLMETQAKELETYGGMPKKSKGGFSVTTTCGNYRVTRRRDTEPSFDERSEKAIALIKDFLGDVVKKRDLKLYEILISLIARNNKQDLEYSEVMNLLKHEASFDDPRWKEGLRLIKESYSNHLKGFGYEFKRKGEDGKWERIDLNFSSL